MNVPTDKEFEGFVNAGFSAIPPLYMEKLDNVAIVIEDQPTPEQREKLRLRCNETLFGLYEGIPLTKRGSGYSLVVPDKITIFKLPIVAASEGDEVRIKEHVRHTLWHEIAHYYGLNHDQIHKLERK